jgi:Crp-like helix-turn-helix protein/TonB-dependent receptor-like protein
VTPNGGRRFENINGQSGAQTAHFDSLATNYGIYVENRLDIRPTLTLVTGARADWAVRRFTDFFLANGDQSDRRTFKAFSPKLGFVWRPREQMQEETNLKQIPCSKFFARFGGDALFEGFVQYLAVRIADQQQIIANLVTVDSEQLLGKTLLQLARKLGKKDPRSIRIELKISHEELSEMVGTTRPRISMFMQRFRNLGLIEANENHFLVIKEKKLTDYLAHIA